MKTIIGHCPICGAPILTETIGDGIVPEWTCGHFGLKYEVQVNK